MRGILKGMMFLGVAIALLIGAFSVYAHFVMDYSLENLAFAVSRTQGNLPPEKMSPMAQQVYQSIVQDLTIQEATKENADLKNVMMLDLAAHSLAEGHERAGYIRAGVYLKEISKGKTKERSRLLLRADEVVRKFFEILRRIRGFFEVLRARYIKGNRPEEELGNYAATLLLNRARERERNGDTHAAVSDYRKYLKVYPGRSEEGLVTLSLANLLINQQKYEEASKMLNALQLSYFGSEEGEMAASLLRKIGLLKEKERTIQELEDLQEKTEEPDALMRIQLRLGLAYLATHRIEKAEHYFTELQNAPDKAIQTKAKFYLGWVYKMNEDYSKSTEILLKLLEDPQIKTDLELAAHAQLAEIYYKTGNVAQSLNQYQAISKKAKGKSSLTETLHSAWVAFSELEQANIYFCDIKDIKLAKEHLNALSLDTDLGLNFQEIEFKLQAASKENARDLAFQILVTGKNLQRALDLFTKYYYRYPTDVLTLAGLATVYVLMGDLEIGYDYAKKAYQLDAMEYTISTLAYVEGLRQNYWKSIEKYEEAMGKNSSSVPVKFNLAYMLLKVDEYARAIDLLQAVETELVNDPERKFVRAKTMNNLGVAFWESRDVEKAAAEFREALKLYPDFGIAKQNLTQLPAGKVPQPVKLTE